MFGGHFDRRAAPKKNVSTAEALGQLGPEQLAFRHAAEFVWMFALDVAAGRVQDLADADTIRQAQRLRTAKQDITPEPNGLGR